MAFAILSVCFLTAGAMLLNGLDTGTELISAAVGKDYVVATQGILSVLAIVLGLICFGLANR
jgi:hypothetical protein